MFNKFPLQRQILRLLLVCFLLVVVGLGLVGCSSSSPNASMTFSVQLNGRECSIEVPLVGIRSIADVSQLAGYAREFKSSDAGVKLPCGWEALQVRIIDEYQTIGKGPQISPFEQGQVLALVEWDHSNLTKEANRHNATMVFPLFSSEQSERPRYSFIFANPDTAITEFDLSIKLPGQTGSVLESAVKGD